jgi:hypothetical protein
MPVTLQELGSSYAKGGDLVKPTCPARATDTHPVTGVWIDGSTGQGPTVATGWGGYANSVADAPVKGSYTQSLYVHQNSVVFCDLGIRAHGYGVSLYVPSASSLAFFRLVKFTGSYQRNNPIVLVYDYDHTTRYWQQDQAVSVTLTWDFRERFVTQWGGPLLGARTSHGGGEIMTSTYVDLRNPTPTLGDHVEVWGWNEKGLFDGYIL